MSETIHASCVILGEAGVLIRGPSGAGKSFFARELVSAARQHGLFARLVSDDRTRVRAQAGRVLASPPDSIAGQIEVRGVGLLSTCHERAAVVRLIVDLTAEDPPRLPEAEQSSVRICGVLLPRLRQRRGATLADVVLARIGGSGDGFTTL